jgi:hypothetical protein
MDLGQALLLFRPDNINSTMQQEATKILARASGQGMTGANMVWEMNIQIMAGLFYANASQVQTAFNTIYAQVKYVPQAEEGIQVRSQPLNGSASPCCRAFPFCRALTPHLLSFLLLRPLALNPSAARRLIPPAWRRAAGRLVRCRVY